MAGAVLAFVLVLLEGVVRIAGAGLGCSAEWYLCTANPESLWSWTAAVEFGIRGAATGLMVALVLLIIHGWRVRGSGRSFLALPLVAAAIAAAIVAFTFLGRSLDLTLARIGLMQLLFAVLVVVSLLMLGLTALPVAAQSPHKPGGPCIQPNQHQSLQSIHFYDDVVRELDRIERASRGLVKVASAGQSGEGRELLYATVGTGDTVFWIQGRIHGNERLGTQSAIRLLDWLRSGHPDARLIREELTVVVIPMYNPDGAEFVPASGIPGIRGSVTPFLGLDLNRDWGPASAPGPSTVPFAQPESVAWWYLFDEVRPNYALDYHHVGQAHVVQGTDDLTQFQIGHRPIRVNTFTEEQWRTNREMTMVVYDTVQRFGAINTTLYGPAQSPFFHVPNAVISTMLLGDSAPPGETPEHTVDGALFFEFRSVGQKSSGLLVQVHVAPTRALLTAVADGSLAGYDVSGFDDIPYPQARACGT
jgi:hypothetical protein